MNNARNCSERKRLSMVIDQPENSVGNSDGANGRLHRRDAASVSGRSKSEQKGNFSRRFSRR